MKPAARRRVLLLVALALVAAAAAVILWLPPPGQGTTTGPAPLAFVGVRSCEECHAEETRRWRGSHHDLAMQEPTAKTVLGDFDDARLHLRGRDDPFLPEGREALRPHRRPRRTADGLPGGLRLRRRPAAAVPRRAAGRALQALSVAWDSRPKEQGGQRWFHLYPSEHVDHRDVLHWTKLSQNWNSQCAECHSTNLRKGYRLGRGPLPHDLLRGRRLLRDVPRAGLAPRGLGATGQGAGAGSRRGSRASSSRFAERRSRTWEMDAEARDREAHDVPRDALRGRDLRPLPRPAGPPHRGVPARAARSRTRTARRCSTRGSTTRTGRCGTRSTTGARSSRAGCTRRASPARTATTRTA